VERRQRIRAALIISCLDDAELLLLGTPWETYRDVANELGLDIVR
jgi:hypothetical protein